MKHGTRRGVLTLCLLALLSALALPAAALEPSQVTVEQRPSVKIVVDGTERTFYDVTGKEVHPLYYNGTHYLPVRAIGELMGKSVAWDSKSRTITLTGDDPLVTDADTFGPSGSKPTTPSDGKLTGEEAAKAAALAHAGLKAADVTFVKCKLDWENGVQVYDVEFFTQDGREYDYEINAATGAVVSVDYDAENYVTTVTSGENIGMEKARSIALAKVPGAESTHVRKLELDYDDGRLVYEVEIFYNGMEYEGEIDAYSGEIVQWEADRD